MESCVDEAFKLRNLVTDQAEISVKAMEQSFSVPRGSTEYAQKDNIAWTKVDRKKEEKKEIW